MRKIIRTITVTRVVAVIKNITTGDVQNVDFPVFGKFGIAKVWRMANRYAINENERVVDVQPGVSITARYAMSIEDFIGNAEVITDDEPEAE